MRSIEDKDYLRARFEDTKVVENFLTDSEIQDLIKSYRSKDDKIQKNTGPVVSSVDNDLLDSIVKKLKPIIGDFEVYSAAYFDVKFPHIIHNDDQFDLPLTYKAITLPLHLESTRPVTKFPYLCMFEQYYLDGPSKFFNGDNNIPTYYNKQVYEYSGVENKTNAQFSEDFRLKYLTHLRPHWLNGLSLKSIHEWRPGNAIIFDAMRLHCASDFRQLGITSKLGISIFTRTRRS